MLMKRIVILTLLLVSFAFPCFSSWVWVCDTYQGRQRGNVYIETENITRTPRWSSFYSLIDINTGEKIISRAVINKNNMAYSFEYVGIADKHGNIISSKTFDTYNWIPIKRGDVMYSIYKYLYP